MSVIRLSCSVTANENVLFIPAFYQFQYTLNPRTLRAILDFPHSVKTKKSSGIGDFQMKPRIRIAIHMSETHVFEVYTFFLEQRDLLQSHRAYFCMRMDGSFRFMVCPGDSS